MFKKGLLLSGLALILAGCGGEESGTEESQDNGSDGSEEKTVVQVASHLPPMTDVVEIAGDVIEEPYEIELVEVSDNIQYNEALLNEEVDANFAQHEPFMEIFNEERDGNLVALQPVYNAIVGFYSPVYDSIEELEDGAEVAIPSDATNEARALMILDQQGIITLASDAEHTATVEDIEENPKNLEFTHIDLLNLTGAYEDGVPLVFNYPTYISSIDLTPEDAVLLEEDEDNTFAIQLVAREDNQDSEEIQAVEEAFTSQEVHDFLMELSEEGHLEPAFEAGE
ncbi:MetQ/NlpA family ABC transporter substrate-binding protein [Salinicoccus sp. RF5]|uniref:MetQ/NlpA family ABC transporter substrate-binding protein n=1 Tax=Salinicoccus sp. RF5 TaxID=2748874 RepID=UPI001E53DC2D|nr:MetQ/NlpA family ABC transporter substrate-binding protein [Salinicoccus sp. RF5]MCC4723631.1 MetQ/NlpA family ABC transporter substrate-binding protein [Salinicoccus sp. RF5]